jgi:hypothetical protein
VAGDCTFQSSLIRAKGNQVFYRSLPVVLYLLNLAKRKTSMAVKPSTHVDVGRKPRVLADHRIESGRMGGTA